MSNATSSGQLEGPFRTIDISIPFGDFQVSYGGDIWQVSGGPSANLIGGVAAAIIYVTYWNCHVRGFADRPVLRN